MRFTLIEMKNLDVIRVQFIASRVIITTKLKHKTEILKTEGMTHNTINVMYRHKILFNGSMYTMSTYVRDASHNENEFLSTTIQI